MELWGSVVFSSENTNCETKHLEISFIKFSIPICYIIISLQIILICKHSLNCVSSCSRSFWSPSLHNLQYLIAHANNVAWKAVTACPSEREHVYWNLLACLVHSSYSSSIFRTIPTGRYITDYPTLLSRHNSANKRYFNFISSGDIPWSIGWPFKNIQLWL